MKNMYMISHDINTYLITRNKVYSTHREYNKTICIELLNESSDCKNTKYLPLHNYTLSQILPKDITRLSLPLLPCLHHSRR